MSTRVIAQRQGVSVDAVKFHVRNILDKLGMDTRAQLRAWEGVPLDSSLQHQDTGERKAVTGMTLGPIGQISHRVSDIAAAVGWYRDVLGLPHLYTYGDVAFFDAGGTRLFLSAVDEGAGQKGESIIYFRVEDIHAVQDALTDRGVVFVGAPHMIHRHESGVEEWMSFFTDPDGHSLALMAQTPPIDPLHTRSGGKAKGPQN